MNADQSLSFTRPLYSIWYGNSYPLFKGRLFLGRDYLMLLFTILLISTGCFAFFATVAIKAHAATVVIGLLLYLFTVYYLLRCGLTEPGIIPRGNPNDPNNPNRYKQNNNNRNTNANTNTNTNTNPNTTTEINQSANPPAVNPALVSGSRPSLVIDSSAHSLTSTACANALNINSTAASNNSSTSMNYISSLAMNNVESQRAVINQAPIVPTQLVNGIEMKLKYCQTCNIWRPYRSKHCR
jgi:hypothetical protein